MEAYKAKERKKERNDPAKFVESKLIEKIKSGLH
jgi:hypothetical protein